MDGHSDYNGRIPRLPYELQLGIFCEMTDMDSVRSLAQAYPYCKDIFQQNEKRITDIVYINKACEVIGELTGSRSVSLRLLKWCILLVYYEGDTLDCSSPWLLGYFSNEKLPYMDPSTLESKFEGLDTLVPRIWEALEARAHYNETRSRSKKQDGRNTTPEIEALNALVRMFLRRSRRYRKRDKYVFPELDQIEEDIRIYTKRLICQVM
ncbi:hypothetical protein F5Y09DRAFT_143371 [Xylaria sp. FL1042]|nr:hypothetical protein F5Y09DRAFT_143371 [Xylaria sp. FL1042]